VVRYFGGILLGTSGLINAYKHAAIDVLNKAEIIEKDIEDLIEVNFDYAVLGEFMHIIKEMHLMLSHSEFNLNCSATIAVRKSSSGTVLEKLRHIENLKASIIGNKF
jgi:putative IMPACT (imprinted ancient) family translation regulator